MQHRPFQAQPQSPSMAALGPSSSISSFMLDNRTQSAQDSEEEKRRYEATETEVVRLMHEIRTWRVANSAQWVAWGIVQAKVPGLDESLYANKQGNQSSTLDTESQRPVDAARSSPLIPDSAPLKQDVRGQRPEGLKETSPSKVEEPPSEDADEEEFDYLGYAQERAMFFWGDVLQLGIVKEEELPQELLAKVKIVDY